MQEPIQEHRTLDFSYASVEKEHGEANMKKRWFLYVVFTVLYFPTIPRSCLRYQ